MTTPQSIKKRLVEEFDNKFYHDHEEKGLTYLRNDVVGWLRTALTTYGDARDAAARAEERERIARMFNAAFLNAPEIVEDRVQAMKVYLKIATPTNPPNN